MILTTQKVEGGGEGEKILKTDRLGRVRTPRAKREAMLAEYGRSGMSAVEFAKWSGVKYQTFATWVQKAGKVGREIESGKAEPACVEPMRWAEAICAEPPSPAGAALVLYLGGGVRVEARDGRVAAELLAALGVRGC